MSLCSLEGNTPFYARIKLPNGSQDDYSVNDMLYSEYEFVEEYPEMFAIWFSTNSVPIESSYELRDNEGDLIFSKSGMSANTLYKDTIVLSPGCYKFQILDTGGNQFTNEDGLSWWANNDGSGYARLKALPGSFFKYYQADFGTELTDYFRVPEWPVGLSDKLSNPIIEVYPNPANNYLNIDLELLSSSDIMILITDINGKEIEKTEKEDFFQGTIQLDVNSLKSGIYNCLIRTNQTIYNKSVVLVK